MAWHTNELSPGSLLIQDGDRVVGSINKADGFDRWNVEVLWDGDDITYEARDYLHALSFIEGVEAAWNALVASNLPDPVRRVIAVLPNDREEGLKVLDQARALVERFKR